MKRCLRIAAVALAAAVLLPEVAFSQGSITVSVSPSAAALPFARTTPTYNLRWSIAKTVGVVAPVISTSGTFSTPTGQLLGTNAVLLTDSALLIPGTSVVTERLRVPPNVVRAAQNLGAPSIVYTRVFTGGGAPPSAAVAVTFRLVGGLGGPFEITFFRLRFEDDSSLKIAKSDESIHAIADISYTGQGAIEATWEVSDSTVSRTAGAVTSFQRLERVRRHVEGSGRTRLRSPRLPMGEAGLHLVRLRFTAPTTAFELPDIRYFVLGGHVPGLDMAPLPLELGTPPDLAALAEETPFSWEPVSDTGAYQLEIYAIPKVPAGEYPPDAALEPTVARRVILIEEPLPDHLVTGVVVPPDQTQLTLPPDALQSLEAGRSYSWRVRALAIDGSVLAESPPRELRVPPSWRGNQSSGP